MGTEAASSPDSLSLIEQVRHARDSLCPKRRALLSLAARTDSQFWRVIELLLSCRALGQS